MPDPSSAGTAREAPGYGRPAARIFLPRKGTRFLPGLKAGASSGRFGDS